MDLDSLVSQFLSCTLPKSEWTHQAHLRVGAWHVHHYGPDDALQRLRTGIRRLNDAHGTPNSETRGYHETITAAYCRLIALFLCTRSSEHLEKSAHHLIESPLGVRNFLLGFYSAPLLMSTEARQTWKDPDIRELSLIRVVRANQSRRTEWKNGLGWTEEIAVSPIGASLDNFDWRISIAGTESDAAFSTFPSVDRSLAILNGVIELSIAGNPSLSLDEESTPVTFSGDVDSSARIELGPLVDFNVMTRRGSFVHRLIRQPMDGPTQLQLQGNLIALLSSKGTATVSFGSQHEKLAAGDLALFEGWYGTATLIPERLVNVLLIEIKRA